MELVGQGIDLMLAGMAIVFVFLTLLVICTSLMSRLIGRYLPEAGTASAGEAEAATATSKSAAETVEADELAAIAAAVDRHRRRGR